MRTKLTLFAAVIAAILFLQACDGLDREYDQMPPGEHFGIVYGRIIKAIDGEEPEIYEMSGSFTPGAYSGRATFATTIHTSKNKDKLTGYDYNFEVAVWGGPDEVTLYTNKGDLTYEEYRDVLFARSEMPAFETFGELYRKAIDASGFDAGECHVSRWWMDKFEGRPHFQITVKANEGGQTRTSIFDTAGNVAETVDGENDRD